MYNKLHLWNLICNVLQLLLYSFLNLFSGIYSFGHLKTINEHDKCRLSLELIILSAVLDAEIKNMLVSIDDIPEFWKQLKTDK